MSWFLSYREAVQWKISQASKQFFWLYQGMNSRVLLKMLLRENNALTLTKAPRLYQFFSDLFNF
jgi:hypothetical protein